VSPAEPAKVVKAKGRLPLATVLRCRIRHFTDGAVIDGGVLSPNTWQPTTRVADVGGTAHRRLDYASSNGNRLRTRDKSEPMPIV
jgi:hypothetical protein